MVWFIRLVIALFVLVALVVGVSFVVAPPKNFGAGLKPPAPTSNTENDQTKAIASRGVNSNLNRENVVPLGASIVHTPAGPAQRAYTTRGRIDKLPGEHAGYLMIHHAHIPDFLNRKGEVVGMDEMVMEFPAFVPGVTLDGLAVGEPVEFTFEVRWDDDPVWVVTNIIELPPEAELGLKAE